jgi:hypothetical protein
MFICMLVGKLEFRCFWPYLCRRPALGLLSVADLATLERVCRCHCGKRRRRQGSADATCRGVTRALPYGKDDPFTALLSASTTIGTAACNLICYFPLSCALHVNVHGDVRVYVLLVGSGRCACAGYRSARRRRRCSRISLDPPHHHAERRATTDIIAGKEEDTRSNQGR